MPPLAWQRVTLSAKLMLPRWIRQTLPATPESSASPVPKSYSEPVTLARGEPLIGAES
jgi:hypothetical protein